MNKLTLFANQHGGMLDLNVEAPWSGLLAEVAQRCEESLAAPRAMLNANVKSLRFCFTMEEGFNAHCKIDGDDGLIVISGPAILRLWQAARSVVTGGARYIPRPSDGEPLPFDTLSVSDLLTDADLYKKVSDYNDHRLSRNVVFFATDVLLNHELAHISRGHASWAEKRFGMIEIDENDAAASAISDIVSQTLEWDADAIALQRSVVRALALDLDPPGRNEGKLFPPPAYNWYGNVEQCLHCLGVSVYLLSRFFEIGRLRLGVEGKYPPAWFRIHHAIRMVAHTIFVRSLPAEDAIAMRVMVPLRLGAFGAEEVWCSVASARPVLHNLTDPNTQFAAITDRYLACWKRIDRQLADHRTHSSIWDAV
jgi:hypothetical protein